MKDPTVQEAKRFGVYSCRTSDTLRAAARKMTEEDISSLVIVDEDGYLQGILTRTDLLRARCSCDDWADYLVGDWMSEEVVTVRPKDHLTTVATILHDKHKHRVVAVREEEEGRLRPLAVISDADVVYHMTNED